MFRSRKEADAKRVSCALVCVCHSPIREGIKNWIISAAQNTLQLTLHSPRVSIFGVSENSAGQSQKYTNAHNPNTAQDSICVLELLFLAEQPPPPGCEGSVECAIRLQTKQVSSVVFCAQLPMSMPTELLFPHPLNPHDEQFYDGNDSTTTTTPPTSSERAPRKRDTTTTTHTYQPPANSNAVSKGTTPSTAHSQTSKTQKVDPQQQQQQPQRKSATQSHRHPHHLQRHTNSAPCLKPPVRTPLPRDPNNTLSPRTLCVADVVSSTVIEAVRVFIVATGARRIAIDGTLSVSHFRISRLLQTTPSVITSLLSNIAAYSLLPFKFSPATVSPCALVSFCLSPLLWPSDVSTIASPHQTITAFVQFSLLLRDAATKNPKLLLPLSNLAQQSRLLFPTLSSLPPVQPPPSPRPPPTPKTQTQMPTQTQAHSPKQKQHKVLFSPMFTRLPRPTTSPRAMQQTSALVTKQHSPQPRTRHQQQRQQQQQQEPQQKQEESQRQQQHLEQQQQQQKQQQQQQQHHRQKQPHHQQQLPRPLSHSRSTASSNTNYTLSPAASPETLLRDRSPSGCHLSPSNSPSALDFDPRLTRATTTATVATTATMFGPSLSTKITSSTTVATTSLASMFALSDSSDEGDHVAQQPVSQDKQQPLTLPVQNSHTTGLRSFPRTPPWACAQPPNNRNSRNLTDNNDDNNNDDDGTNTQAPSHENVHTQIAAQQVGVKASSPHLASSSPGRTETLDVDEDNVSYTSRRQRSQESPWSLLTPTIFNTSDQAVRQLSIWRLSHETLAEDVDSQIDHILNSWTVDIECPKYANKKTSQQLKVGLSGSAIAKPCSFSIRVTDQQGLHTCLEGSNMGAAEQPQAIHLPPINVSSLLDGPLEVTATVVPNLSQPIVSVAKVLKVTSPPAILSVVTTPKEEWTSETQHLVTVVVTAHTTAPQGTCVVEFTDSQGKNVRGACACVLCWQHTPNEKTLVRFALRAFSVASLCDGAIVAVANLTDEAGNTHVEAIGRFSKRASVSFEDVHVAVGWQGVGIVRVVVRGKHVVLGGAEVRFEARDGCGPNVSGSFSFPRFADKEQSVLVECSGCVDLGREAEVVDVWVQVFGALGVSSARKWFIL